MLEKSELSQELIEALIENDVFYDADNIYCKECIDMEDEQYTCTSCWGQGGNISYKANDLLKATFNLKYNNSNKENITLDEIKSLIKHNDISCHKWLFLDDNSYKHLISSDDEYADYRTVSLYTVFHFLFDKIKE